jgi:O-antigen/teichoic acid export membrane protein
MTPTPEAPARPADAATDSERHFRTDHLLGGLGERTVRGFVVTLVSQALKFLIGISGTVVLARLLTPEDYGLIGMVAVFTGFVSVFQDLGLSAATVQRAEISQAQVSNLFWVNVAVGVILAAFIAGAAPFLARFYGDPRLVAITAVSALGFLFGGLTNQHEALLRRQMRFTSLAVVEIAAMLVSVSMAVSLAWYGAHYWSLVFSQLALVTTAAACVWTLSGWRPGLPTRRSGVRSMLLFGGNLTGYSIINYWARNLDNLLIGRVWGAAQLGLYSRAYQLLLLPVSQITAPITAVAVPALSRLVDSPERYRRAYVRILAKLAMVTMPLMAFMIVTSDWVVRLALGSQWMAVSPIFAWLGLAGLVQPLSYTAGWLLISQGRARDMFRWGAIGCTIIIASICAGLPWGALGVAMSYSICNVLIVQPFLLWWICRTGPIRPGDILRAIAPAAWASFCLFAVLSLLRPSFGAVDAPYGLALAAVVATVVVPVAFLALPSGRLVLLDTVTSLRDMVSSWRSS